MLLPKVIGNRIFLLANSLLDNISFKATGSIFLLGISIPIVFLPGTVATLVAIELVLLAMSSDKLIIFEVLIPAAGSNSYKVTTGPALTLFIFPIIPKSRSVSSKNFDCFSKVSVSSVSETLFSGSFKKDKEGKRYSKDFVFLSSCSGKLV